MRAVVVDRYGGPEVARVAEVAAPEPRPGEVLVEVRAAAVTSGDARMRGGRFPPGFGVPARLAIGLRGPRRRILGSAFSGVVAASGSPVTGFRVGDAVCGMLGGRLGAHAERLVTKVTEVVRVPEGVSHEDAAGLLFGGTAARWFLVDRGRVVPGTEVLVNGASGAVGSNAVQLARHLGASVTAVTSRANAELVTRLGARRVIDHATVDVATLEDRFDVVFDTVGNLTAATGRRLLRPGGRLLLAVASLPDMVRARGDVLAGSAPERVADIAELLGLVARGDLVVIHDGAYGLDGIAEAYRRVDSSRKRGNIVVVP